MNKKQAEKSQSIIKFNESWLKEGKIFWGNEAFKIHYEKSWHLTNSQPKDDFLCFLINKEILVAKFTGNIELEDAKKAYAIINQILSSKEHIHYVLDISGLDFTNYYTRIFILESEIEIKTKTKCRFYITTNAQRDNLLMYKELNPLFFHSHFFVDSYTELLEHYTDLRNGEEINNKYNFFLNKIPEPIDNQSLKALSKKELIEIIEASQKTQIEFEKNNNQQMLQVLKTISKISWEQNSEPIYLKSKDKSGGFHYLFNSVNILQRDIYEIANEMKKMNLVLGSRVIFQKHQLTKKEARLSSLIENTPDLICSVDRDYNILELNQSYQTYLYENHKVKIGQGDNIFKNLHKSVAEYWKPIYERAFQGETFSLIDVKDTNGNKVFYEIFFNPIYDNAKQNEVVGISFFMRDITIQKNIENQLKIQNEELQKINEELDRFVYSASHDLRAPLSSLLGLINLSKMENPVGELNTYLALMDKSVRKLDSFIKDITNHSRNIRLDIARNEINFEEIIQESFDNLNFMVNNERIEKIININQSGSFYSDESRLSIILNNIYSNAIRYSSTHKKKPFIKTDIVSDEKELSIIISDNGLGIDTEHIDKIFDMFYRATNHESGSGLGLYIVKETVHKLNGKIEVDSKPGVGTRFTIFIPNSL